MVKRNSAFSYLHENYLFKEIKRRCRPFNDLISLSIGDTSEPLASQITEAIQQKAGALCTPHGYQGYGNEQGDIRLREKISEVIYHNKISPDEIFISDGAKCEIGRLHILFGRKKKIAVQNPTYPVYVDTALFLNKEVFYLPSLAENDFFPSFFPPEADLIFLCSPNNPTGSVMTYTQLEQIVNWAKINQAFIIFDAAYSGFIQDPTLPQTIYDIPDAKEVAIEVSSFSKLIGFTGVRLGWSVVPQAMTYQDGGSVKNDYSRVMTTFFNGASILAQAGGIAALAHKNEIEKLCSYYLENAQLIKEALFPKGFPIYGGENAPYLWVDFGGQNSWHLFQVLLEQTGIITIPGSGFGSCGEGFLRFSAFGNRHHILKAVERIQTRWPEQLSLLPI